MTATPKHRLSHHPESPSSRVSIGVVKWFSPAKGYGFIEKPSCARPPRADRPVCGETDREIFVHHSNIATRESLARGDRVRFEKADGPKGPFARRVVPL